MAVVSLYNGIYKVLSNDETVLNYLGLGTSASPLDKAKRLQKRHKPQELVTNMPLIAFYATPGSRVGENYLVYETNFIFDIYTKDDVSKAQKIGDRILELFEGVIHPMMGVESFESMVVSMHESAVDLANCYCFTVVINFSVSIEQ